MKHLITIQHPAHVHFYKHAIERLEADGHEVSVVARDKEVALDLLEAYGINHTMLADGQTGGLGGTLMGQIRWEYRLLKHAREMSPDVITGIGGTGAAHVGQLCGAKSVVFTDTEHAPGNKITFPFADEIWTPECFTDDAGSGQKRYPGYHELAYLHPDRFEPDPSVLEEIDLSPDDRYVVMRIVSWDASHDAGEAGFDDVHEVVERLESTQSRVLITSEAPLPESLEDRRATFAPHLIHDVLAYADLFIGEGATMAVESAVLGTPAVYVNTLRMGYTDEIEARYGLLTNCQGSYRHQKALDAAVELLAGDTDWGKRREQLLAEKQDTTAVILNAIRNGGE